VNKDEYNNTDLLLTMRSLQLVSLQLCPLFLW